MASFAYALVWFTCSIRVTVVDAFLHLSSPPREVHAKEKPFSEEAPIEPQETATVELLCYSFAGVLFYVWCVNVIIPLVSFSNIDTLRAVGHYNGPTRRPCGKAKITFHGGITAK